MSFAHIEQDLPPPDDFIAWSDALAYFTCHRCRGKGWYPTLPGEMCSCDGGTIVVYLGAFFANLAIAAGLSACDQLRAARAVVEATEALMATPCSQYRDCCAVSHDFQCALDGAEQRLRTALSAHRERSTKP